MKELRSLTFKLLVTVHTPALRGGENISKVPIGNLFVKFKLYRGGEVVGNTLAHGADIGPGERFRFSAPTTERFDEAKLSAVDVY